LRAVILLLVLSACEMPDPTLTYAISDDPAQSCGTTNCAEVIVPCDAVISIRVFRPGDEAAPIVTVCEPLPQNRNKDLCAISSVKLADRPIKLPNTTLEAQIVIWPREEVVTETGELDCAKHEVKFDAVYGFPISQNPAPAIGGHTYYHPGDDEIRVTLGCTDLDSLHACAISTNLDVTASVESFENVGVLVSVAEGNNLLVSVGEPKLEGAATVYTMKNADMRPLSMFVVGFVPIWTGSVDIDFNDIACVQVLSDTAQATASVKCKDENVPPPASELELRAVHLPKPTIDQILVALGLTQFPPNGLTVGMVVDASFNPVMNETILAPGATIRYLSADRSNANGIRTSSNGIFVSQDAGFGTRFSVPGSSEEVGGQIQGKVTVVLIQK
jgi:hypothetical protein